MSDDDDDLPELPSRPVRKKKAAPRAADESPPPRRRKSPDNEAEEKPAAANSASSWVAGLVLVLFFIPVLGFAIFMAVRQEKGEASEQQAFAARMDSLLQAPKDGVPPAAKPGRLAVVDVGQRALHHTHKALWNDRRANSPDQADYIVQLKEVRDQVATYTSGSKGIKVTYHITLLDKPTWTILGQKTFLGSDPPLVTVGSKGPDSDVTGAPPATDELNAYYHGLIGVK